MGIAIRREPSKNMANAAQSKKPRTKAQTLDLLDRYEQLNRKLDMIQAEMIALNTVIQEKREKLKQRELYQKLMDIDT